MRSATGSWRDGGVLVYLIETPTGSILYQDTTGCWSGVLRGIRADAAILALSGRPNLDGEPFQGSLAGFVAQEAAWLGAKTVIPGHHDNWLGMDAPDVQDVTRARLELAHLAPRANLVEVGYLAATSLFK
jgi:L-ascorbate metabolism protein UlaG (beta-lactamase superfamily)